MVLNCNLHCSASEEISYEQMDPSAESNFRKALAIPCIPQLCKMTKKTENITIKFIVIIYEEEDVNWTSLTQIQSKAFSLGGGPEFTILRPLHGLLY